MGELKKLDAVKDDFVKAAGKPTTKEVKPPRKRSFKLDEDDQDYVKIMVFGPVGGGKTDLLAQLVLDCGLKVASLTTDMGDTGHLTVKTRLVKAGRKDLFKNYCVVPLDGWGEMSAFLRDPWKYDPNLAEFLPDVLAWDGFSTFQQVDVSEYVGDMAPKNQNTDRGDFRESGLVLEQQDWGAIRNATIRVGDNFLTIRRPDGKPLHKIITCHEAIAYKPKDPDKPNAGNIVVESYKPLLQGAGGQLLLGGFDLIMRASVNTRKTDAGPVKEFVYTTAGSHNLVAKNRGFDLRDEEPANMKYVWGKIMEGLGRGLAAE